MLQPPALTVKYLFIRLHFLFPFVPAEPIIPYPLRFEKPKSAAVRHDRAACTAKNVALLLHLPAEYATIG